MQFSKELLQEYFDYRDGSLFWKKSTRGKVIAGKVIAGKVIAGKEAGTSCRVGGYYQIAFMRKSCKRSRLVWIWHNGSIPEGMEIDHINRVRDDDRIENLRIVTDRQNNRNKTNQSEFGVGVYFSPRHKSNPYRAMCYKDGRLAHLGYFPTEEAARAEYFRVSGD
jgi:Drexlerviridae HNH endonuclease